MAISPLQRVQRRAGLGLSGLDRGHRPSHRPLDEGLKKLVVVEEVRIDRWARDAGHGGDRGGVWLLAAQHTRTGRRKVFTYVQFPTICA